MTAKIQVAISIIVGVGLAASATIGDMIVTDLAVTLQTPKTVPRRCVGKYFKVAM